MDKILIITYLEDSSNDAGDKIYSKNIIEELKKHFDVELITYGYNPENTKTLANGKRSGKIRSTLSLLPHSQRSYFDPNIIPKSHELKNYRFIFIDHFRLLWIYDLIPKQFSKRIIYLSHNIESISRSNGFTIEKNWLKKFLYFQDYIKTRYYEQKQLKILHNCSAISEADYAFFKKIVRNVILLKPGYRGIYVTEKCFSNLPLQVGWVGSFDFFAKQLNLIEFCNALKNRNSELNFRLSVIGRMSTSFKEHLQSSYSFCDVHANVSNVHDHLQKMKAGLVCEPIGGGFKLKSIDYIFSLTPIFALEGTCEGIDLIEEESYISGKSIDILIEKLIESIDDNEKLNFIAKNAQKACENKFSWDNIIKNFINDINSI